MKTTKTTTTTTTTTIQDLCRAIERLTAIGTAESLAAAAALARVIVSQTKAK